MNEQFFITVRRFLSPIVQYLDDPDISEIMVNAPNEIWIEQKGKLTLTESQFGSEELLMSAVNNIAQFVGRRIDRINPRLDARLPDGSRVHIVLPPCARKGICMSIRKFSKEALTLQKLIEFGSITEDAVAYLRASILCKRNLLVSGGTGSGKTSLLNAVSSLIPDDNRIIVIEDSAELQLQQSHILSFETQTADRQGQGEVTIRDLLTSSLRLRPDRIVIGEIRSGEALDFLQALNTGHGGSMGTVHANSPIESLSRLETLTLFSGLDLPMNAIRQQVASAINIIIQTSKYHDGSRKISHISEVDSLVAGEYQVRDIFRFVQTGLGKTGKIEGQLQPTGSPPAMRELFRQSAISLPSHLEALWT